ncbi:MAG: T9SS type A sorting domain-containing protein [Flavobacterium sp.]|nr:T9SS type A sorting domain-containing protein [Flavobacterium sp.]
MPASYTGNLYFKTLIDSDTSITGENVFSNIVTYNVVPCSPQIVGSPSLVQNVCSDSNNGSATFTFNRALNSGEYFNMTLYEYNGTDYVFSNSDQVTQSQFASQQYTATNLGPGTYYLRYQTVFTASGTPSAQPENSVPFTITAPTKVAFTTSQVNVICKNEATGSITVTATGGSGSYLYSLDNATWQTNNVFSGLAAGSYSVYVKDSNNCQAPDGSQTVTITEPATRVTISNPVVVNPILNGGNTGSIDVDVSDGALPYNSFLWVNQANQTIANTEDITSLIAGTYTLTVTDASGCTATANFTLVDPPVLVPLITVNQQISCNGANNGILSASATGGTPGVSPNPEYSYEWRRNTVFISSNQQISNLIPGVYELKVTDSRGGFQTTTYTLSQPTPIIVSNTITNVTCNGANNGSITTIVSGGTPFSAPAQGYSYAWRLNGNPTIISTNQNLTAVGSGTYSCEIKDANNCIYNLTNLTITENPSLTITLNNQVNLVDPAINNGSINHFVSGGTGTYTYLWNTGQTSLNRTNLAVGTYTFTVTDSNGCSQTATYTITSPPPFTINILENNSINCFGQSTANIQVIASGGTPGTTPNEYSYSWTGANIPIFEPTNTRFLSNLPAGTYTIQVRDAKNVLRTLSYTVTQPTQLTATYSKTDITCNGLTNGTINITTSGGTPNYTFQWRNQLNQIIASTEDVTGLAAGTYSCTITDANNCIFQLSNISITSPSPLFITDAITPISTIGATDGSIQVTVTGGTPPYNYTWTNSIGTSIGTNSPSLINLEAGSYTLSVTDANGCLQSRIFSVDVIQPLTATINKTDIYCNGNATGSITVNPSGGLPPYTYSINGTNFQTGNTFPSLTAGNYTIIVKDANTPQSSISLSIIITEPAPLTINSTNQTNINCFGSNSGTIDLTVSGGSGTYSFVWRNQSNVIVGTTEDITNLNVGTYTCTIRDANPNASTCPSITTNPITITTRPQLVATLVSQTNILINGQSTGAIDINVTGGFGNYTYAWSNGAITQDLTAIPAGTYSVIVTDELGCTTTLNNITITQPAQLIVTQNIITPISCFEGTNGSITANVSGGVTPYIFTWTLPNGTTINQQILSNRAAGVYSLVVRDANNATATTSITLTQPNELAGTFASTPVSCGGNSDGSITINPTGGSGVYTYLWNTGATSQTVTNASVGNYVVLVTDSNGCEKLFTGGQVLAGGGITITETIQNVTCGTPNSGSISLVVSGGSNQFSILWDNPTFSGFSVTNLAGGTYTGTITDIVSNCIIPFSYTLSQPINVSFNLPAAITLCNGQTTEINPLVTNNNVTYNWTATNGFTSNEAIITVSEEGTYSLTVTASNGCSFTDSVLVTVLSEAIESEYLVASQTYKDEEIILINVSEQTNETYEWIFPSQAIVISQNSQTAVVKFTEVGVYEIGLKAVNNSGCILYDYNQLVVEENPGLPEDDSNTIVIKEFKLYPNPITLSQLFTIDVELSQSLPFSIAIYNVSLGSLVDIKNFTPRKFLTEEYQLNISSAMYYVVLRTPGNVQTKKLIIN